MNMNRIRQPRVLGMLLAKLVLSVASPLAGQPNDGTPATTAVVEQCAVVSASPAIPRLR